MTVGPSNNQFKKLLTSDSHQDNISTSHYLTSFFWKYPHHGRHFWNRTAREIRKDNSELSIHWQCIIVPWEENPSQKSLHPLRYYILLFLLKLLYDYFLQVWIIIRVLVIFNFHRFILSVLLENIFERLNVDNNTYVKQSFKNSVVMIL